MTEEEKWEICKECGGKCNHRINPVCVKVNNPKESTTEEKAYWYITRKKFNREIYYEMVVSAERFETQLKQGYEDGFEDGRKCVLIELLERFEQPKYKGENGKALCFSKYELMEEIKQMGIEL